MANKKRNLLTRSKPPPRTEDRATADSGVSPPNVNLHQEQSKIEPLIPSSDDASIRLESDRALTALRRGNHAKALRLMKDACLLHKNSALVYRAQGNVQVQVASLINDNAAKQRHLKNAVESARRAVSLSPKSIEFAAFYANLLYDVSSYGKGYEEVVKECERALSIDNPIDPAKENLHVESQSKVSTAEVRIANLRKELQSLVQKCRVASLWTSMENLESSRPNEIEIAIKIPEEQRRKIEVQVAAARLLQLKSDSMQTEHDEKRNRERARAFDVNAENNKLGEPRKNVSLRMDQFRPYWNSMSVEKKRGLLEPRICDLREHFSSFKDGLAAMTFSEAIGFAQKNKTWKFTPCCFCDDKFKDSDLRMQHINQEHKTNISWKLKHVVPQEVDADWADMLINCAWKPVDTPRAVKIIEKQLKSPLANFVVEDCMLGCTDGNEYCLKEDDCNSSCEEPNKWQVCSGSESRRHDDISKFGLGKPNANLQPMACLDDQKWPLSDDAERAKILENIHAEFLVLLRHKCLSKSSLSKVIKYTIEELQNFVPLSQLHIYGLNRTPLCICFLEVPQLKKTLKRLQVLSNLYGLNGYHPDKGSSLDDAFNVYEIEGNEAKERIVFNGDSSCLLLDDRLLRGELTPHKYEDAVADDGSAMACTIHHDEVDVLPNSDALIHWLFSGPSIGEELALWTQIQETTKNQGMKVIQKFEKEFDLLEMCGKKKSENSSHKEALQAIESICIEELEKRKQVEKHIPQSYASLLRSRQEELLGTDNDAMSSSSRFELNAISSVLTEAQAQAPNVNQFEFEEALTGISSLRSSDHEHQEDACITIAIQRQIEKTAAKFRKIEELVMRSYIAIRPLGVKLRESSSHDCRSIMLPLLKSFMRAQFEALVNEDAKQKSDAAGEAFLSELALDAKKNISKGGNHKKHPRDNSKAKKKNKHNRKVKDSKATCGDELYVLQEENEAQAHFSVGYDGDYRGSEIVVYVSPDKLELQEEELKHELEERKLKEMLEYQRQIEDEAKQKNLAKQNKNAVAFITEELEKTDVACSTLSDENGPGVPVTTLEETKVTHNSCQAPALQRTRRRRSRTHGKVKKKTLQAQKNLPSTTNRSVPSNSKVSSREDLGVSSTDLTLENISGSKIFGPGLRNDVGEYNCFLNVIVQSLWHLRKFRDEFLSGSTSMHVHIGDPCVVCSLQETFNALSSASANMPKEAVSPTNLRIAVTNLHPYGNLFHEMNDASEVLKAILGFLHRSSSSGSGVSNTKSAGSNCTDSWDCASDACIAHTIFGMNIFRKMNCKNCGIESEKMKFTYFFHIIRAITLRGMKRDNAKSTFDELLELAESHHYRICDPEVGGCGELNSLHHILSTPPHVFITVLDWESPCEPVDDISTTLRALTTEIDIGVIYEGLDPGNIHSLISMVCYYQQHYICFVYNHGHEKWIMYDDEILQVIGDWDDVLNMCEKGYLQPEVLFFESAK